MAKYTLERLDMIRGKQVFEKLAVTPSLVISSMPKPEGTALNSVILPPINLVEMIIKDDISVLQG